MVKKFFRANSKRLTCSKKFKIERKVKEHKRKVRKDAKTKERKAHKKDPGIPNSLPFKEDVINEARKVKEHMTEYSRKLSLAGMVNSAQKREKDFSSKNTDKINVKAGLPKSVLENSRSFYKEFRKVIDDSDVILEILDARDPMGTRCLEVEEEVVKSNKKLILILSKIDLVPKENVQAWLTYLRRSHPTLPFKANLQEQQKKLGRSTMKWSLASENLVKSSQGLGAEGLLSLIGNYCRHRSTSAAPSLSETPASGDSASKSNLTSVTVGVVGLPNTGKSALINTLKRSKVCPSSQMAGLTKHCQIIQLDKNVRLLDSPGIVLSKSADINELMLRNCVRVESLPDPVPAVEAILRRCPKQQLLYRYNIADFHTTSEFLVQLATRIGKMRKGGIPDTNQAARKIINDWIHGCITYYTEPPETNSLPAQPVASILTELSPEFKLVDLDEKVMRNLPEKTKDVLQVVMPASGPLAIAKPGEETEEDDLEELEDSSEEEQDDDDEEMESDEEGESDEEDEMECGEEAAAAPPKQVVFVEPIKKKNSRGKGGKLKGKPVDDSERTYMKGLRLNKERGRVAKYKKKKLSKINRKLSEGLSSMLTM